MKKVITYGTFDLFHKGHYNILKRAKEEGDYLIVGVTGERYDNERGKLSVQDSLATRIENVQNTGFADKIIVEEYLGQKIPDILKYDVDVLVIGSDWKGKFDHLNKYCEVKYLERTKNISSTQIREESLKIYSLGIATDDLCDNDAVIESKSVSGIHAESVYAAEQTVADDFCNKFELDKAYTDYIEFLESADIIYIKTKLENRAELVEKAILNGKNVICDAPISLDKEEEQRLAKLAKDENVFLLHNVTTLYLQAFGQLLWMARGNLIGDLVSVNARVSREYFDDRNVMDYNDVAYYSICPIIKILGTDFNECDSKLIKDSLGNVIYGQYNIKYDNAIATAEVNMDLEVQNEMEIIGTEGSIIVPEDWWRIGYFRVKEKGSNTYKRYSSNFEGNGFRYLIQALQNMMKIKSTKSEATQGMTEDEMYAVLKIMIG